MKEIAIFDYMKNLEELKAMLGLIQKIVVKRGLAFHIWQRNSEKLFC